jgi:hypothetical protein
MAKSKQPGSKQDRQWAEAKRRCRLNQEDIRMARELGLKPRSLIKNIPSPQQQWKLPVKQWIHELYEKKTGKMPGKKRHTAQSLKQDEPAVNGAIPLQAYANELSLMPDNEHSTQEVTTMADWKEYADELRDDNELLCLPESPLYREIREENQRTQKRQKDFRLAAEAVAQAFGQISGVEKVVLFGSVAQPLLEEKPRNRKYRRAGISMLHECKDIDLAVWVSDSGCLRAMQKARSRAVNQLWREYGIGVAHHQVDVFIMEPGSNRYLGRLCTYSQCPKGKPECRVPDCGSTPLLRQHDDFELNTSALTLERTVLLV